MTDVTALLAEAEARPFTGWDFSAYGDRTTIERPWDYTQMVVDLARSRPICWTWGRAAANGWPRSRCTRR